LGRKVPLKDHCGGYVAKQTRVNAKRLEMKPVKQFLGKITETWRNSRRDEQILSIDRNHKIKLAVLEMDWDGGGTMDWEGRK
jgi:hypothetical protein